MNGDRKPFDVFISHSSGDKHVADAIKHHLQQKGVRCWKAPDDIAPGESWAAAIVGALKICRVMVLIWSDKSSQSGEVEKEVGLASDNRLTVIPFRIEKKELTGAFAYHLGKVHWLDALGEDMKPALMSLANRVAALLPESRPLGEEAQGPEAAPQPPAVPSPSAALSSGLAEWQDFFWWASRNGSIRMLDQKRLLALQEKYKLTAERVDAVRNGYRRNLEEFTQVLREALEDVELEDFEVEAIEHTRTECCISTEEAAHLMRELTAGGCRLRGDVEVPWIAKALKSASEPETGTFGEHASQAVAPPADIPPKDAVPVAETEPFDLSKAFDRLRNAAPTPDVYWEPNISKTKLKNARKKYLIPADETVFGLIDATVFGSADNGLAFGRKGLYLHNDWASKTPGAFLVPWDSFTTAQANKHLHPRDDKTEFFIGDGVYLNCSGSKASIEDLDKLFTKLSDVLENVKSDSDPGVLPSEGAPSQTNASRVDAGMGSALLGISKVFDQLRTEAPAPDVFWAPNIPKKKLDNARKKYLIPADETVFGLIDATVFGSADNGLAFGSRGLYLHNNWTSKTPGAFHLPWGSFTSAQANKHLHPRDDKTEFFIGDGVFFNRVSSSASIEDLDKLFTRIFELLRTAKQ